MFMLGSSAHANKRKKRKFDKRQEGSMRIIFAAPEDEFVKILVRYLRAIRYVQRSNEKVLANIGPRQ